MSNHERPEKLRATAFDGLAAALSPALIIGMIGSLVFFLVIAFYRGHYDARLMYILALYTAASVLVARIAIESDRARAAVFAAPLAIAAMLGMMRFVTISGELAALSWIINVGLLVLTYYLADRITFDCTLLEEDRESLQGGLLQTIGSSVAQAAGQQNKPAGIDDKAKTSKQPIGSAPLKKSKHNPGVWVLYFALIAFPLFGVGQLVIPDERQRSIAFWCLVAYLACALALLMTTSLLGMRRYLRQRGAMMPPDITAKWLVAGGLITCLILVACMLMPLPGKQLSIAGMKIELTSPDNLTPSSLGRGNDGRDNGRAGQAKAGVQGGAQSNQADGQKQGKQPAQEKANGQGQPQNSQNAPNGEGKSQNESKNRQDNGQNNKQNGPSEKSTSDKSTSDKSSSDKSSSGKSNDQNRSQDSSTQSQDPKQGEQQKRNAPNNQPQPNPPPNQATKDKQQPDPQNPKDDNAQPAQATDAESPNSEPLRAGSSLSQTSRSLASSLLDMLKTLGSLFKWLLIAVLAGIVLFYVLTHFEEVKRLISDLMNFINSLMGRRSSVAPESHAEEEQAVREPTRRPFSSFQNPFARGLQGWQGPQVVQHTFAALEAWAAQRGRVRAVDQTAEEFARKLVAQEPELDRLPLQAAGMLDRVMFAGWQPSRQEVEALEHLWDRMSIGGR